MTPLIPLAFLLAAASPAATAKPHVLPIETSERADGLDGQKFSGEFVKLLDEGVSAPQLKCLETQPDENDVLGIRANGNIEFSPADRCAVNPSPLGLADEAIMISSRRLAALVVAVRHFQTYPRFARNVTDMLAYNVRIVRKDNEEKIYLYPRYFLSPPIAGCPSTGPIGVTFFVNRETFETHVGNMAC